MRLVSHLRVTCVRSLASTPLCNVRQITRNSTTMRVIPQREQEEMAPISKCINPSCHVIVCVEKWETHLYDYSSSVQVAVAAIYERMAGEKDPKDAGEKDPKDKRGDKERLEICFFF